MQLLNLVEGEKKVIVFTITDEAGDIVDVSSATLSLSVRRDPTSTVELFNKADGDFVKTDGATGIIKVTFDADDLDFDGKAYAILTTTIGTDIDKNVSKMVVQPIGTVA